WLAAFSLAALACGGKADREDGTASTRSPPSSSAPESTTATPATEGSAELGTGASTTPDLGQTAGEPRETTPTSGVRAPMDRAEILAKARWFQASSERALAANCGSCHGPVSAGEGGIGHIEDCDWL